MSLEYSGSTMTILSLPEVPLFCRARISVSARRFFPDEGDDCLPFSGSNDREAISGVTLPPSLGSGSCPDCLEAALEITALLTLSTLHTLRLLPLLGASNVPARYLSLIPPKRARYLRGPAVVENSGTSCHCGHKGNLRALKAHFQL